VSRRRNDWGAIGTLFGGLVLIVVIVAGVWWITQQPTCYGIEPDGEVETLWPCPSPHQDGDRFPITEDQYADREID
jgi:hypothetical protein